MAWIESHQELGRHPKTNKLTRILKETQPETKHPAVIGYLHYLWWWALDYAQNGSLARYDNAEIAEAARWEGDADTFVNALIDAGYVDKTDEGLQLHDWYEYAGKLVERREKDRERKKKKKGAGGTPDNSDGTPQDGARLPSVHNPTQPNQTKHNQTKPNRTEQNQTAAAEAPSVADMFSQFWDEYPKKVGKAKCAEIWKKLKPSAKLFEKIMTALRAQKQIPQWQKDGGAYIPHPQTWLNNKRWEDELPEVLKTEGGDNGRTQKAEPAITGFHAAE